VLGDLNAALLDEAEAELGDACAIVRTRRDRRGRRRALVARAVDAFGAVDIGVNCAGLGTLGPITSLAVEQWDLVLDVCLKGVFLATSTRLPQCRPPAGPA
jgi:NAD(P)-dependent dehydrogenase (short-subunit alcohol dehydrogenase family)